MSLQDQLLKSGLVNQTKLKQVKAEKRKQTRKQQKNKITIENEAKQLAEKTRAEQAEKDRLLNEQRNLQAAKKQQANQVAQLIEANKLPQDEDGIPYRFTDDNKVKDIYVSEAVRKKIISGRLAIVRAKTGYEVVASEVAEKIRQVESTTVVVLFENTEEQQETSEDDPYKDFEIPDDLIW
jgi:uncharacterized protein YaiL (DUF2058 family)